jgi:hypothetical protein
VMKGGITSGVVYPHAVCELARVYRLRNIGGTSAGAIAAAAAGAAELGRTSVNGGFKLLAGLPGFPTGSRPTTTSSGSSSRSAGRSGCTASSRPVWAEG